MSDRLTTQLQETGIATYTRLHELLLVEHRRPHLWCIRAVGEPTDWLAPSGASEAAEETA